MEVFKMKKFTDAQKFSLVRREAIYTGVALVGLTVLGTVGVWLVAIFISAILSKVLFKDVDLGGDENG